MISNEQILSLYLIFVTILNGTIICASLCFFNKVVRHVIISKSQKQSIENLKSKYPLVSEDFIHKSELEQLLINNQEIKELKIKLQKFENKITELEEALNKIITIVPINEIKEKLNLIHQYVKSKNNIE